MQVRLLPFLLVSLAGLLSAQEASVRGSVEVLHHSEAASGNADVVVWLTPAQDASSVPSGPTARLLQKGKKFIPHVVAVTQGTEIEFPYQDLFFHNVFSIHQGKTIDLGLYESGAARKVRFTQAGVSYIFFNIHPEMSAVVVVLRTRYFAVTDQDGAFQIGPIPPGTYKLGIWYELSPEGELTSNPPTVEITPGENVLPKITLHSSDAPKEHFNKYGEPYYADKESAH
jgi:plastocyanin